jgi:hypothetical protein
MEKAIDFRIPSAALAIALTGPIHVWESDDDGAGPASNCDFDVREAASKRSSLLAFPKGKASLLVAVAKKGSCYLENPAAAEVASGPAGRG